MNSAGLMRAAHDWVHARNAWGQAGGFGYRGEVATSYDTAVAEMYAMPCLPDGKLLIVTQRAYSTTTSRHQHAIRVAGAHLPRILVDGGERGTATVLPPEFRTRVAVRRKWAREQVAYSAARRDECVATVAGSPVYGALHASDAIVWQEQMDNLGVWFAVRVPPCDTDLHALLASARTAGDRAQAQRAARKSRTEAERVVLWLGKKPGAGDMTRIPRIYLRQVGDTVETSHGARTPLADARRAWAFASRIRAARKWQSAGRLLDVGGFHLDEVTEAGVRLGCHQISWEEVDRFASVAGWRPSV